ncbi:glycosyltransferase family 2 protein [Pseudomonas typographi]|uniref:Glycosyltransferase family 2 protein n=1 Tax=Pseudomonas typographi TaxID=2715964 RepID=A0ABR7ZAL4_9PSED|nr:glycosyltransferase family 2 protein [Pseudomonas typographi]MBD1602361.1 glycosyltransferase family 2 protein [Pseudomonas typographi]
MGLTDFREAMTGNNGVSQGAPVVAILMCTYNGDQYISDQLNSIISQTYPAWKIFVADDGSSDSTLSILQKYQAQFPGRIEIYEGPGKGVARNFWSLVIDARVQGDFYAFCDQDDIWMPSKLERGVEKLKGYAQHPALYCGRTCLVSSEGKTIGFSPLYSKVACFQNALVQNIASGNTMMFNHPALALFRSINLDGVDIVMHDWLAYLIVSAMGGKIVYDHFPYVRYRQHGSNLVGAGNGTVAKLKRVFLMYRGQHKTWNAKNCKLLLAIIGIMPAQSRRTFKEFLCARTVVGWPSLQHLWRSGVYRQTVAGNLSLYAAAFLGKL